MCLRAVSLLHILGQSRGLWEPRPSPIRYHQRLAVLCKARGARRPKTANLHHIHLTKVVCRRTVGEDWCHHPCTLTSCHRGRARSPTTHLDITHNHRRIKLRCLARASINIQGSHPSIQLPRARRATRGGRSPSEVVRATATKGLTHSVSTSILPTIPVQPPEAPLTTAKALTHVRRAPSTRQAPHHTPTQIPLRSLKA